MRLFKELVSLAFLAELTSALRLNPESHIEIQTFTRSVTSYTAIFNTTEFRLCLGNISSHDTKIFGVSASDVPAIQVAKPLGLSEEENRCVFSCLKQQEIDYLGFFSGEVDLLKIEEDFHEINDELITWRGSFS